MIGACYLIATAPCFKRIRRRDGRRRGLAVQTLLRWRAISTPSRDAEYEGECGRGTPRTRTRTCGEAVCVTSRRWLSAATLLPTAAAIAAISRATFAMARAATSGAAPNRCSARLSAPPLDQVPRTKPPSDCWPQLPAPALARNGPPVTTVWVHGLILDPRRPPRHSASSPSHGNSSATPRRTLGHVHYLQPAAARDIYATPT